MKHFICIVAGLALMWGGRQGINLSTAITKETISTPPPATTSELPRDPAELMEDPAIQKRLDEAADLSRMSGLAVLLGALLILWPMLRLVARPFMKATKGTDDGNEHLPDCDRAGADVGRLAGNAPCHSNHEGHDQPAASRENNKGASATPIGGDEGTAKPETAEGGR